MTSDIRAPDLNQALAALNLPPAAGELWRESWPASQAAFDPGRMSFLSPEFVADTCRTLDISAETRDLLLGSLALFDRRPLLKRLAWHCHCLLFPPEANSPAPRPAPSDRARVSDWPRVPRELGEPATMFYALVALSGAPGAIQLHRTRGIPPAITVDTLSDLELWIKEYRTRHGMPGFDELGWLSNHLSGHLYKLGRLQFNFEFWEHDFHVFRNRKTRQALMLTGSQYPFRADGQFSNADGGDNTAPDWVSTFREPRPAVIRGNPVSPLGHALPGVVELAMTDWEPIFRRGDPALGVHIPATGPMTPAECGDSFRQACRFFPEYFPDRPWKAFTCTSWLQDPQFERYLPESSNIVRFLREMHLLPVAGANATQHYQRGFGIRFEHLPPERIDEAPQNTSLQKILVRHVKAGGRWRMGGGVLFPEDLDWGAQVYRRR